MQTSNEIKKKILNDLQGLNPFSLVYYYMYHGEFNEAMILYDYLYDAFAYTLTISDLEDITKSIKELMEEQ